jgi:hypothetical protein
MVVISKDVNASRRVQMYSIGKTCSTWKFVGACLRRMVYLPSCFSRPSLSRWIEDLEQTRKDEWDYDVEFAWEERGVLFTISQGMRRGIRRGEVHVRHVTRDLRLRIWLLLSLKYYAGVFSEQSSIAKDKREEFVVYLYPSSDVGGQHRRRKKVTLLR